MNLTGQELDVVKCAIDNFSQHCWEEPDDDDDDDQEQIEQYWQVFMGLKKGHPVSKRMLFDILFFSEEFWYAETTLEGFGELCPDQYWNNVRLGLFAKVGFEE